MMSYLRYLVLALSCVSTPVHSDPIKHETLFWIERSKNANIIQYDAQIGPNGKLLSKEPVVAYWVRLAEQGQIKKLTWLQETFAFGFGAKYNTANDTVTMNMAVDIGRPLTVSRDGDRYRAKTTIDGAVGYLEKIFIQAHKRGFLITVDYIDIFGFDTVDGSQLYERLVP